MKQEDWVKLLVFIVVAVVLVSVIYGPFILVRIYGPEFSYEKASEFLNNLVGISALVLSIVAMWVTLMGMQWQHDLQLKMEGMIASVKRIEQKQDGIIPGRGSNVTRRKVRKKPQEYKEEKKS